MTASELLSQATAEGLTLELVDDQIRAQGPRSLLSRWASELRQHREEVIAVLRRGPAPDPILAPEVDTTIRLWLVRHPDGRLVSHSFCPPASEAEVRAWYPQALTTAADEQG